MPNTVLEKAKVLLSGADETLLGFAVDLVCDSIKNYCNVTEVPEGLHNTAASMVLDLWRQSQLGSEQLQAQTKSISRGDTSYSFTSPAEQMQAMVSNPTFARNYTPQLNAYRKLRR